MYKFQIGSKSFKTQMVFGSLFIYISRESKILYIEDWIFVKKFDTEYVFGRMTIIFYGSIVSISVSPVVNWLLKGFVVMSNTNLND